MNDWKRSPDQRLPPLARAAWQRDQAQTSIWMDRPAEAAPLLRQALEVHQRLPSHEAERLRSELLQGELDLALGHGARATTLLACIDAHLPAEFPALHHAAWALRGRLAAHAGQAAEAEQWLGQAWREALAWRGRPHPALAPVGLDLMASLGASHRQQQQAELLPELQRSVQAQDETSPWRARLEVLAAAP
ncbi:MAG: hypothetical protein OEY03_11430 [Rhizobacter sp.]|nr:hypothetical protein [Rhizobacter sp.]